jgi:TatD DNase family protein
MFVDTHAHLTDPRLSQESDAVLERAREAGVEWVVTVGSTLEDSRAAVALAGRHEELYATVGIHPHAAGSADGEAIDELRELAGGANVVAIGETGLDYHYDNSPRADQRSCFEWHLTLGIELDLPVVVHAREADDDVTALLRHAGASSRGILHCFTAGRELLDTALGLGWYVSFAGIITFPRYADVDLLRSVPGDRLLVETDSPYLAPVPHRGKRNEPAFVPLVARRAAELRGEPLEDLAAATTANARRIFGVGE